MAARSTANCGEPAVVLGDALPTRRVGAARRLASAWRARCRVDGGATQLEVVAAGVLEVGAAGLEVAAQTPNLQQGNS